MLALVDSDPYGLKILSVYMKGEVPSFPCLADHCYVRDWQSAQRVC